MGLLVPSARPPTPEVSVGLAVKMMGDARRVEPGTLLPAGQGKFFPGSSMKSPSSFG